MAQGYSGKVTIVEVQNGPNIESNGSSVVASAAGVNFGTGFTVTDEGGGVAGVAIGGAGLGDVSGPGSSTDTNLAGFDGTTGKTIKDSGYSPSSFLPSSTTIDTLLPDQTGNTGKVLKTDGGASSWTTLPSESDPIVGAINGIVKADGAGTISEAIAGTDYQDPLTTGDLTETTSAVLNITGGADSVIGTGVSIEVKEANTSQAGYLTASDWNTFNAKIDSSAIGAPDGVVPLKHDSTIDNAYINFPAETDPVVGAINGIVKSDGAGTIAAAVANTDYQTPLVAGTDYLAPTGDGTSLTGVIHTETDPVVGSVTGLVKADGSGNISAAVGGTDFQTPLVADTDYLTPGTAASTYMTIGSGGTGDVVGPSSAIDSNFAAFDNVTGKLIKDSGLSASSFLAPDGDGTSLTGVLHTETDPVVGAITGIVKADGAGAISAAASGIDYQLPLVAGTDYVTPDGDGTYLTGVVHTETDPVVGAITGIVKANGSGVISAAVASTDYVGATSGSAIQKANGSGGLTAASAGTDYQAPLVADTDYLTPSTAASTYQPTGTYLTSSFGSLSGGLTVLKGGGSYPDLNIDHTVLITAASAVGLKGGLRGIQFYSGGSDSGAVTFWPSTNMTYGAASYFPPGNYPWGTNVSDPYAFGSDTAGNFWHSDSAGDPWRFLDTAGVGTDYAPPTTGTAILMGNGTGGFAAAVSGTDYQAPLVADTDYLTPATAASTYAVPADVTVTLAQTNSSITPVADGTYTVGIGGTQDGTITVVSGQITAVQQAI